MAPTKFQIYVDQSMVQGAPPEPAPVSAVHRVTWPRYIHIPNQKYVFDMKDIYPMNGGEYSFEEINLAKWKERKFKLTALRKSETLEVENSELKSNMIQIQQQCQQLHQQNQQLVQQNQLLQQQIEQLHHRLIELQQQNQDQRSQEQQRVQQHVLQSQPPPSMEMGNRLSILPQSLQPETSCHEDFHEQTSVVDGVLFGQAWQKDKFTLPIDQSQFIREHCPTSTPSNKDDRAKKTIRRMSRPSMGGSPTMKLSPITETSRECNSKSSTSSSATNSTPGTTCKRALQLEPVVFDEPDRPLDPNDPTTYRQLLKGLVEPLERRHSYVRTGESMPTIENGVCFGVGGDRYLVDKEISKELAIYTAQVLDSSNDSNSDLPNKTICFRVDRPSNDWLFYICGELHKRLVRQKLKPDIELSVMNADPGLIYTDGSILVDEYYRCVPLDEYIIACSQTNKPFPRAVAAYIALELIQLTRVIHTCGIVHMNITSKNIIITNCPTREDITNVNEQTSVVKLIGFDRAIDTQLLPNNFKFDKKPDYIQFDNLLESEWMHELDWIAVLNCIHRMFFLEDMQPVKEGDKWKVNKQFKGFPTDIWTSMFEQLLNIKDLQATNILIERLIDELCTWIKANISFVLREAVTLDMALENFCKATNRSVRLY